MKTTIKKRIEEINSGIVPEGYEKTSFGIFPCDWERDIKFGELFDFYGGLGKSREELGDQGVCYLHYGDMHTNAFNKVTYEQYSLLPRYDIALKGNETFLMQDGDIAFLDASEDLEGTSRAVLIDNVNNEPFIAGLHTILAKEKQSVFSKYYKQYITISQDVKKQFQKLAVGFKVYGLNRESIKKIKISYPKDEQEQSSIAEILMQWDKAIELQEKLIEAYQKSKKYYLNKMFPKKGSNIPEIRFPGFTTPWEPRKLNQVALIQKGEQLGKAELVEAGRYYVLNGGMVPSGYSNEFNAESNTISISEGGNSCGYVALNLERFWSGGHNYTLQNLRIDTNFLFQYLKGIESQIMALRVGSGLPNIQKSAIAEIDVAVPKNNEQKCVGQFLTKIDNLITLHQQKRDKLLKQRKAMQQYLLTGIVRV